MPLNLVDSHCHLDMLDLAEFDNDMANVIAQANDNQVSDFLSIAVDLESFPRILETAKKFPNVSASVGLHPCHVPESQVSVTQLTALADDVKVIAIGETGLDYYMNDGSDPLGEDFAWQRERFRVHIQTAIKTGKPLIIHTRDAREDTLKILEEENAHKIGGIMHCFVEDIATAEKALAMGFYISFSGIVTFKNAKSIQEVAKVVPDERILIETDSPYLAPVPMRGKKNQPAYVAYVAEYLADLRGTSVEHIAKITRDNYFRLFSLEKTL
ncbi:TatD family hydrolase [sulfur-oxidizing endosymbiont of Gigantopelta aegis]|uniref:TatD family hydrolase n=1 Tax=sulfur-oxidizing endosymbiont of Gigantopelta aegis TaxID=2794934 RepID=UPI0018DC8471|nr:TatD family hydrolase [sulfur-oxidizing endosymbiont of Gigantopelta aegis]